MEDPPINPNPELAVPAWERLSLEEYTTLSMDTQGTLLWHDGFSLEQERTEGDLTILLYALYDFYVEVYVDMEGSKIVRLRPFRSQQRLSQYFL